MARDRITIKVENLDQAIAALRKVGRDAEQEIGRAVQAQALIMTSNVKRRIQREPKTGETYQRGNISHRASAPGEAPATDTGTLVSSIYYTQEGPYSATIGSRIEYAYHLEFGTFKMQPRPTWTGEAMTAQRALQDRINAVLVRAGR